MGRLGLGEMGRMGWDEEGQCREEVRDGGGEGRRGGVPGEG